MKKKTITISLTTILVIGLIVFLLLRSQNANAAQTASDETDNETDSQANAPQSTGNALADEMLGITQKDPMINTAIEYGKRIGEYRLHSPSRKTFPPFAKDG